VPDEPVRSRAVAGIDVGGSKKGAHLVILRGTEVVLACSRKTPEEMVRLCVERDVEAVGIDAPCRWAVEGARRVAETTLARQRISLFSTPTRERAAQSAFYEWMLTGELIYATFCEAEYPLFSAANARSSRVCFETFPHAITCAMLGMGVARAAEKRVQRRGVLEDADVDTSALKTIDDLDAALCALTAGLLLEAKAVAIGDEPGGYIVVPKGPGWRAIAGSLSTHWRSSGESDGQKP
jgi:predicted nuclease with RNAse H fold